MIGKIKFDISVEISVLGPLSSKLKWSRVFFAKFLSVCSAGEKTTRNKHKLDQFHEIRIFVTFWKSIQQSVLAKRIFK